MSARVFVPADSSALSVGADAVAGAILDEARRRGVDMTIVRTGSRGLFWLEPLIEVETAAGRIGYGPVAPDEVARLFEAGFLTGGSASQGARARRGHPLSGATAAAYFCPLWAHRSAVDRRLPASWRPSGPRARIAPRTQGDDRGDSGLGPARARRRGLSDRRQMADDGRDRRRSKIRRLQRRRRRQRHLRRPDADGGRPVPLDRGHGHRRALGRRDEGLRLYPLRISARVRGLFTRDRAGAGGGTSRPERARLRPRLRSRGEARRRRLYLRRGDVAPGKP